MLYECNNMENTPVAKKATKKSTKKSDTQEDVNNNNNVVTAQETVEVESKPAAKKATRKPKKTTTTENVTTIVESNNNDNNDNIVINQESNGDIDEPKKAPKTAKASSRTIAVTKTPKYMIVHCRHEGCYDFQYYEDEKTKTRLTSIRINPPKVFVFSTREEAQDFFGEYMNDVDVIDQRCKKDNNEIEHIDYCTCGIIEMDDDDLPILFYNKRNQIFLIENSAQVFTTPQDLKDDVENLNLTNELIRKCRRLDQEQRDRYIELGRRCEACSPPKC